MKGIKRALTAILANCSVNDEELWTALTQAEELVNTQPLKVISTDSSDPEALTPMTRCEAGFPLELVSGSMAGDALRRRWTFVQQLVDGIWHRWLKEVVPLLNANRKWQADQRNVAVDDVVICVDQDTPRSKWPLGRVLRTFPGSDCRVRVVDVQMRGRECRQAVLSLIPLVNAE